MDSGIRPASDVGTFNVGGESVTSHNDGLYKKLREHVGVPASFLEKLDFSQLEKFGGKGGKPMTLVQPDRKYLVKELAGDDHKSLLKHGGDIVDHLLRNESLIVPVLLHFTRHGKHYLAMRNCFPSREGTIWHRKYDLKGNRDDKVMDQDGESVPTVNKRCFHFHTCWYGCDMVPLLQTSARQRYYAGKKEAFTKHFSLAAPQAERVIAMCKADAELFGLLGTMDYSLMVGVMKIGTGETVPPADGLKQFVVVRARAHARARGAHTCCRRRPCERLG